MGIRLGSAAILCLLVVAVGVSITSTFPLFRPKVQLPRQQDVTGPADSTTTSAFVEAGPPPPPGQEAGGYSAAARHVRGLQTNGGVSKKWTTYLVSNNETMDQGFELDDETAPLGVFNFSDVRLSDDPPSSSPSLTAAPSAMYPTLFELDAGGDSDLRQERRVSLSFLEARTKALQKRDTAYVKFIDTYHGMQRRTVWAAERRLRTLLSTIDKPSSATIVAQRSASASTKEGARGTESLARLNRGWLRCLVLWLDDLSYAESTRSRDNRTRHACDIDWAEERRSCVLSEVAVRDIVTALRLDANATATSSLDAKSPRDITRLALQELYSATIHRPLLRRRVRATKLTPRSLQPLAYTAAEAAVGAALEAKNWTTRSISCVRVQKLDEMTLGFGEGPCLSDSPKNKFSPHYAASSDALTQSDRLRLLLRIDAENVLASLMIADPLGNQTEAKQGAASRGGHSCGLATPPNKIVAFMRNSRWMFDAFLPFALERDADVSASMPPGWGSTRSGNLPSHADKFRVTASRPVAPKSGSNKLGQILGSLHYELDNVCISPYGFGLSGYTPDGVLHPQIPPELRDETRTKIKDFTVRRRYTKPTHFIDKPLFLSFVLHHADNFGHVLYRVAAQQELLRRVVDTNTRIRQGASPDDYLVGYYVVNHESSSTYGTRASTRHLYQLWNQPWFSFANLQRPGRAANPTQDEEDSELCFRRAFIGHDGLYMYHTGTSSSENLRKRYLTAASKAQTKVNQALQFTRERFLSCMVRPLQQMLREEGNTTSSIARDVVVPTSYAEVLLGSTARSSRPIRILVMQRRTRRLANINQLLAALALELGRVGAEGNVDLVDTKFSGRSIQVLLVDFEFLTTAEQATIAASADILIGMHGTGLQWMLLMQPGSVLVEIQYPGLGCVKRMITGTKSFPGLRLFCEFGKTSTAAGLTHIAFMAPNRFGDGPLHTFNVLLLRKTFMGLVTAALCALHRGSALATSHCSIYYPKKV